MGGGDVQLALALSDIAVAGRHAVVVGPFESGEVFDVVLELDLADVAGVSGGQRLGFGGRDSHFVATDVIDFIDADVGTFDLRDEQ